MKISKAYNELINESQDSVIKKIVEFLNAAYEPKTGVHNNSGEYFTKPVIISKVDDSLVSPVSLLDYLKSKFKNLGNDFLIEVIKHWYDGKFKNGEYKLSKLIPM